MEKWCAIAIMYFFFLLIPPIKIFFHTAIFAVFLHFHNKKTTLDNKKRNKYTRNIMKKFRATSMILNLVLMLPSNG